MRDLLANDTSHKRAVILIGVPIDFADFVLRVKTSDWLAKFDMDDSDDRDVALRKRWEEEYKPVVADPICELLNSVKDLSIDVKTQATLNDLTECSKDRDLMILFCHWKGAEVEADDVVAPIQISDFLSRVLRDESEMGRWLLSKFETLVCSDEKPRVGLLRRIFGPAKGIARTLTVREVLSDAVYFEKPAKKESNQFTDFVLESAVTRQTHRRELLNSLFRGLLRPGNRLELYDGLHNKEAVDGALGQKFEGTIDLTTCTSTILADYLGNRRDQKLRIIQYPTVQQFAWCAECVNIALRLYMREGLTYQDARLTARNLLVAAVQEVGLTNGK